MNKQHGLNTLALFSTRYALKRNTSADFANTSALKHIWSDLSKRVQLQILEEIEGEKDLYGYNSWLWDEFLQWAKDN